MDIEQISDEVGISRRKVKAMLSWLRLHKYLPPADRVHDLTLAKKYISRGQQMSVEQMLLLIEKPELIKTMGSHAAQAREQIKALDNPKDNAATNYMAGWAASAASRDAKAITVLMAWVKETIPPQGCTYQYLALRIAYSAHENTRSGAIRQIRYAMVVLRQQPEFADWFTVRDLGHQKETFYHPPQISL